MIIKNALVFGKSFEPVKSDIIINGEKIASLRIADDITDDEIFDFEDCIAIPGMVDIHIHGCNMADCTDGKSDSANKMSKYLASMGITSFCPTTMTLSEQDLEKSFRFIASTMGNEDGAYIHGINMEGPFISPAKKGAQAEEHIKSPDIELFNRLNEICPVKLVDIAPEMPNADKFIEYAKNKCVVSLAHTTADHACAAKAIETGITHATHLHNAMTGITSREAGAVGAVFDSNNVFAEMICDGIHICPETLRISFRLLGEDRSVVISDAMMASGLEDGTYSLGGQTVIKKGAARLKDGTLAGSATNLFEELKNIIGFGIPLKQAIKSVTINPAKSIGVDKICGSIEEGKNADILILNNDFSEIKAVFIKGKRVR